MKKIAELLSRDLSRRIEEVIQVDQAEEEAVFTEIDEYIATGSIRDQYAHLLKAIAEAPSDPNEAIGIWVSGFFGSGKSSYAKNLGYALQNNKVQGQDFSTLFKKRIEDSRVSDLIDLINARFPAEVIFFDIAKEQDTRRVTQRISEFLYVVLLRHLDYAEDFDIAELEIEVEAEGKLDEFLKTCKKLHKQDWRMVRKGAQRISRASAVLHEIDSKTYPTADSWTHSQRNRDTSITLTKVVERCFELLGRRRPGKALVWVVDEVGQHVARSDDKIEDLRAVVQEFGLVGRNLVKARKIIAPAWMVVTSQEKLEEVVSALDSKRVQIAKLQDRFRHRVDLAPSDIREVATKRVLAKKEKAEPVLKKLFAENQGQLNAALRLERTTRKTEIGEADFVQFYPYPPHYIDLGISIVSGLRLQPGAPKQYGGSNRTIIKQAYEMLVSERTDMKSQPIGTLVTLDKVYELVEGNLTTEKRTDIHDIGLRFKSDAEDQGWTLRVAKAICLLEFVRDLPRIEANIAAFLVDEVGKPAPLASVQAAIKKLQAAQFVRNTDEGWKLQTLVEKKWETERASYLDPKGRDRNEITRQVLREVFGEPTLKTYKYKDYRSFSIGVTHEGTPISDGDNLTVTLASADDNDDLPKKLKEVREESRLDAHKHDLYWCFALSPEIDQLVAELHASREMVKKYDQMRAQNRISGEEASCLQDEKNAVLNYQNRLGDKFTEAMEHGTGLFRGVSWDASALGKSLGEIFKKLYGNVVPDLYPKLEMGSRPLKGDEAEQVKPPT
ncbi:MAG TPA: BREX system P-loop protein BrxC [Gemmataceae bacterium]|nr:BREX system P-loop protein BrxC [Gemmataceae bacterium]